MTDPQITALLATFDKTTPVGRRDYAMALCLIDLGLRVGDVAELEVIDVDLANATLCLGAGKSRRERMLPLTDRLCRAIRDYMRRGRPSTSDPRLFVRHRLSVGVAVSREVIRGVIRRAYASVLGYNTGLRVSEAVGLQRGDVILGPCSSIRIRGKGRKERSVPLWKTTARLLERWLEEIGGQDRDPVFPNRFGHSMSRSGVEDRLERAVSVAARKCPSLAAKSVSPHTLRHTTAMHLLQSGVDVTVIALWLGHESLDTTHQYMEADIEMKRRVLNHFNEPSGKRPRKPKTDGLLDFLNKL